MTNNNLPITNIISVSIQETPTGLGVPNVNNVMCLTTDTPTNREIFGDYFSLSQVQDNYGTSSVTSQIAEAFFSQNPNPLSGGGMLSIAPLVSAVSATPADFTTINISANLANFIAVNNGNLKVTVDGNVNNLGGLNFTGCTTFAQVAAVIQASIIDVIVEALGDTQLKFTSNKVGTSSSVVLATYAGGGTDLIGASYLNESAGTTTAGDNSSGETLITAIARLLPQTFFACVITNLDIEDAVIELTAAAVQAQDMLFLHHISSSEDIGGIATTIQQETDKKTRLLPYLTGGQAAANLYKAAYAGRAFSQDFTGSNTSATMHMKQLATIEPDANMSQTFLLACETAGCDPYVSIQGYPMVFSTGGNDYFDNQYSDLALKFALEVAGFNYLAGTNTKVPQTEQGMNGLKSAYIAVLNQFVNNGELAPGAWNSSQTFGDPGLFINNIAQNGYYVYSAPVALQSSSARNARQAPLVQIACKRAGAIQSSNVIVLINA
jgi:hypothetical protein